MIKHIIFDFGNIFVDLDFDEVNLGIQTYVGMGMKGVYLRHSEVFDSYERGDLSEKDFLDAVSKVGIPRNKVAAIWNSMIVGIPPHRIDFIKSLPSKYDIFLFSNINTLHESEVNRLMLAQNNMSLEDFRKLFKGSWFSHHIGMRKPDAEGFELIIKETGINPSETIFIDDSAINVQGAVEMGMHIAVHDPEDDIVEMLETYINQANSKS